MRNRIGIVLGLYWEGIGQILDILSAISTLGLIGGLSTVVNVLGRHARHV
jgi:hypothetical protein